MSAHISLSHEEIEVDRGREPVLIQHIKNIRTSGTVLPSSARLVSRLLHGVDFSSAVNIVELGPGTGCVTREILRRMRPDARLISLEVNPEFVRSCSRIGDPRLTVRRACASELPSILEEEGIDGVHAVVSSLPLAIMDDELVERILNASRDSLVPDGRFIQYQYSLSRYARVRAHYPSVALAFTSLNVPPAFVYTCTKRPGTFRRGWRRPLVGSVYGGALMLVAMLARVVHDL